MSGGCACLGAVHVWEMRITVLASKQYSAPGLNGHYKYSETSLIGHSMGPENNVGLGGCWIKESVLPYLCMVTVPHIMVGLERMLDYRGVGLARFHCVHCWRQN